MKRFLRGFQTCVVVTVITVLVWIYAENEIIKTQELRLHVRLAPPENTPLSVEPAAAIPVTVAVRCSASQWTELQRRTQGEPLRLEVDTPSADSAEITVLLREELASHPSLARLGINVDQVTPASVTARVERLAELTLPVGRPITNGYEIGPDYRVEPAAVTLLVPARQRERFDNVVVSPRPEPQRLAELPVDKPHELDNVPLTLPNGLARYNPQLQPNTAKLVLSVRGRYDTQVLRGVPIFVVTPLSEEGRYVVVAADRLVPDVGVSGPRELVERIRKGEVRVQAVLQLSAEDLERYAGSESVTLPLRITVPAGLPVLDVEQPPTLTFRVERVGAEQ